MLPTEVHSCVRSAESVRDVGPYNSGFFTETTSTESDHPREPQKIGALTLSVFA